MAEPTPEQAAAIRDELDRYAWLLDECIRIPGTRIRLGLDSVIGLIPGAGDLLTGGAALALVLRAHHLGAPAPLIRHMLKNVGIDVVVGAIPLLGDVFDVAWRANRRNLELLREHFSVQSGKPQQARGAARRMWLMLAAGVIAVTVMYLLIRK
ncbi:DUF4112 domain-containing protein [Abyssibacter sp.]|uniref:DUF4112 domain-containing protein n=1 Tax=Abyssibacter sp. TaxID=2320200 RepID=UPI0025B8A81A|nr:DUF4112 domain-containing protein [Abyssibacter sp.]MCK5859365.1 DUF4112 domain-containing protein [Abyssibacter sp.]